MSERLDSIDIFRGLTILLMVFVNDLGGPGHSDIIGYAPWLWHAMTPDTFHFADIIAPAFLFIMGMSIPLALTKRRARVEKTPALVGHVLVRTLALLFLGVLLVNEDRFSAAAAGIGKDLWYFLATLAVFALWAVVPKDASPRKKLFLTLLKIAAAVLLAALLVAFRGQGGDGQTTWLQTSWSAAACLRKNGMAFIPAI